VTSKALLKFKTANSITEKIGICIWKNPHSSIIALMQLKVLFFDTSI